MIHWDRWITHGRQRTQTVVSSAITKGTTNTRFKPILQRAYPQSAIEETRLPFSVLGGVITPRVLLAETPKERVSFRNILMRMSDVSFSIMYRDITLCYIFVYHGYTSQVFFSFIDVIKEGRLSVWRIIFRLPPFYQTLNAPKQLKTERISIQNLYHY